MKAASIPVSTVMGLGSDRSLGPTEEKRNSRVSYSRSILASFDRSVKPHSHWTSTRVLTLVLPTELDTSQETGSVK